MFNQLQSLNKIDNHWRIKVRLTRMWPAILHDGTPLGFHLILLDNQDYHVHAFVRTDVLNVIRNDMKVGNIYDISGFYVREAYGKHRPVRSPLSILLSAKTIVHKVDGEDHTIPAHKFDLLQVENIFQRAEEYHMDRTFAIDAIGIVENLQDLQMIIKPNGETIPKIKFRLGDGSRSLRVELWGGLTEDMSPIFHDLFERPVIVILASVRVVIYRGEIIITNAHSSKVYINPNVADVFYMRNRLDNDGYEQPAIA